MICSNTLNNHFKVSKNLYKNNYTKEEKDKNDSSKEINLLGRKKNHDKIVINVSKNEYKLIDYDDAFLEMMSESVNTTQNQTINSNVSSSLCSVDQTLSIINALKEEKELRSKKKIAKLDSETSFSLGYKIEDILAENSNCLFPDHYKKVLDSFISLENAINHYKFRYKTKSPTLTEVSNIIQGKKLSSSQLRKIVYTVPHFYIFKWYQDKPYSESKLLIDIPYDHLEREKRIYDKNTDFQSLISDFQSISFSLGIKEKEERIKIFRNILFELVKYHHNNFIDKIKFPRKYLMGNSFHKGFDINRIPQVKEYRLPENPYTNRKSIHEYLRENDIKRRLINASIMNSSEEIAGSQTLDSININSKLKSMLAKKIQAVSISRNINNLISKNKQYKYLAEDLKELVEYLRHQFIINQTYSKDIESLYSSSKDNLSTRTYSKEKFLESLMFLNQLFPNYLEIYKNEFIKISKEFFHKSILEKIENYYNQRKTENVSYDLKEENN